MDVNGLLRVFSHSPVLLSVVVVVGGVLGGGGLGGGTAPVEFLFSLSLTLVKLASNSLMLSASRGSSFTSLFPCPSLLMVILPV